MSEVSDISCPYCHSNSHTHAFSTWSFESIDYSIRNCHNCQARFLSPPPTAEVLALAYDDSYYGEGDTKFDGPVERILDGFRKKRATLLHRKLNGKGKVLDIGCGNGRFLDHMQKLGDYSIHGIEPEGLSAQRARQIESLELKIGALEKGDFSPESLDAITLFHVFEHLTEPKETMQIASEILRPGGWLFMSFPNIGSWQAKVFKGNWLHLDPPRHLFLFRRQDFKTQMLELGFEIVEERHFSLEYNPFGFCQSLLNKMTGQRDLLYESMKGDDSINPTTIFWHRLLTMCTVPLAIALDALASLFKSSATVFFILRKTS